MKNIVKSLALLSAVAAFSASCQKETIENNISSETRLVTFTAEAAETRTAFGDKTGGSYPVLWKNDDMIHVSVNGTEMPFKSWVYPSEDGRTAEFQAEVKVPASGSVRYFAITPTSCYNYFYQSYKEYDFRIPTVQTSTAVSCDSDAQILLARSEEITPDMDGVSMHFEHVTAYGKFSITGLAADAGAVKSVTLKAAKPLTGTYEMYWTEAEPRIESVSSSVSTVTVNTESASDIWFACVPADLSGTTLEVSITAENGDFAKKIDLTGKKLAFEAGVVSEFVIDMTGIEPPKAAGKFVVGSESVPCVSAVADYDLDSWSKSMVIYIGEAAATNVNEMSNGYYLSLSVNLEKVADPSNFDINDMYVTISASSYYSSYYAVGKASVSMANGNLKFSISDATIPEGWSTDPTIAFEASYDGPVTECTSSYNTTSMTKNVAGAYKYYYSIDKLFLCESASASVIMFGNDGSAATAADIRNGECGLKFTIAAEDEGKLLDIAAATASKVEFYDYEGGKTYVAKSGTVFYRNMNGKTPYIYAKVYFDNDGNDYVECGLSCDATASADTDIAPEAK